MKVVRTDTVYYFQRMLLPPWQRLLSHCPFPHHTDPELRNGARGEGRLMPTAAPSPWLRLGLTRCCYILADRTESKSAVLDTSGATEGPGRHGCRLELPGTGLHQEGKSHWASLTDVPPAPKHEGAACGVLSPSYLRFLLPEGRRYAGRRKETTSCTSVRSLRSVGPREVVWLQRNPCLSPI